MFTGIVQHLAEVVEVVQEGTLKRLRVAMGDHAHGLELGASVAVNGTCLTVTSVDNAVAFDVIHETLEITNLSKVAVGDRVNIERSFRVGEEVGGHILSGHISGLAQVVEIISGEHQRDLVFQVERQWMKYLQHKGFVALDGASLTIASTAPRDSQFTVCLIPETIARTTLGLIEVGDTVNLELDAQTQTVVETVERVLGTPETLERLKGLLASQA